MNTHRIGLAAWMCLTLVAAAAAQDTPPGAPENAPAAQTLEQRLNIQSMAEHVLLGGQPVAEDYAALAREKGVTRIISLRPAGEAAEEAEAARQAGLDFEQRPLPVDAAAGGLRLDRAALRDLVESLRQVGEGTVYVHDETGQRQTGIVDFAYQVWVADMGYAEALRGVLSRGFFARKLPGIADEFKRLASGLETLPVVRAVPIGDGDLLGPGKAVRVGSQRLNVKALGEGPPVYVLHGGPGETHTPLRPYLDALQSSHTLVYYDQRGCGRSGKPQYPEAYSLARLAEELDGLREALGHEKISLVGHSTGGVLAITYALAHPERVDRMVIMSSWAYGQDVFPYTGLEILLLGGEDFEAYRMLTEKQRMERRSFTNDELTDLVRRMYPLNFFGTFDEAFRKDWNRRADVNAMTNQAMSRELFIDLDIRGQLKNLAGVPTLVIAGRYDVITPPHIVKVIADGIPQSRFEVFDRSGHYSFVEEHDKFIALASEFLVAGAAPLEKAPE